MSEPTKGGSASADEPQFIPRRCECGQYPDVCARYGHAGGYEPGEAIEPQFISETHRTFSATVSCVECGWTWEGWAEGADDAMHAHTKDTESG